MVRMEKQMVAWKLIGMILCQIRERVNLLLHGCSCKKGWDTRRCSCLKTGKICGPGCRCCTYKNSHIVIHGVHLKLKLMVLDGDIETYEEGTEDMDCAASDDDDLEDLRIYRFVLH